MKVPKKKPVAPATKLEGIIPSAIFPYLKRAGQKASALFKQKS